MLLAQLHVVKHGSLLARSLDLNEKFKDLCSLA
jgi:hypothetical protein